MAETSAPKASADTREATHHPAPAVPRDNRAQAPIRWPRPTPGGIALVLLWLVGVALALFVPALIVRPGELTAPTEDVLTALGCTIVGTVIMMVTSYILYRRTREVGLVIVGAVPAFACLAGGIILAASKLTGTSTGVGVG